MGVYPMACPNCGNGALFLSFLPGISCSTCAKRRAFCELLVAKQQDHHWHSLAKWQATNAPGTRTIEIWFAFPPGMDGDMIWDRLERDEPASWWQGQGMSFGWNWGARIFEVTLFEDGGGFELRDGVLRWIRDIGGVPHEYESAI